jgi:hypothetical protein
MSKTLRVLVACEYSGAVREAFAALGHDAMSCDLLPTDRPGNHYQGDVRDVLGDGWDLMVAHPPCTYLSVSGIHWNNRGRGWEETDKALDFVRLLLGANIPCIAVENPVSIISSKIRRPDQIIQPHQFGHDASKATCLWIKNLPNLTPTSVTPPRIVNGKPRWGNQTDGGQNKLPPSKDRWKIRSTTYQGIAEAMAHQWSAHALSLLTNYPNASAAANLGALFTWNTTATVDASDQATPKTTDGNSKRETEYSTGYVPCPPGDASILMKALARR